MINYRIEGAGPPLLLIHGWGVTFTIWKDLAPLLAPHFQLVMVELPGFGCSSMPPHGDQLYVETCIDPLEELRVHLGFEEWSMLCYSVGTRVGEAYLRRFPERISTVIFLCPLYTGRAQTHTLETLADLDRLFPDLSDWILSGWRISFLIRTLGFSGHRHPYARVWKREMTAQPRSNMKKVLRELPYYGKAPFKVPAQRAIFIWGKKDWIVMPPRRLRSIDYCVPASHGAPMLAAPQIAEIVIRFLSGERN